MRRKPKTGAVTIAFDDAYLDTYKHGIRYLNKVNVKSTIAVPAALIGKTFENRPVVGLKELKDIIKSGHEIASHTLTHPNLSRLGPKDKEAAISEIVESKKTLEKVLNLRISSFVFPYINKNQSGFLSPKVKSFYKSARITSNKPFFNKIPLKHSYSIVGSSIMKKHSFSYLNKQVDKAAKKKLWLIEVYHLVGRKNTLSAHRRKPYRFFIHIDDFKKHIDYILSKDILILTQKDGVRRFCNRYGI